MFDHTKYSYSMIMGNCNVFLIGHGLMVNGKNILNKLIPPKIPSKHCATECTGRSYVYNAYRCFGSSCVHIDPQEDFEPLGLKKYKHLEAETDIFNVSLLRYRLVQILRKQTNFQCFSRITAIDYILDYN